MKYLTALALSVVSVLLVSVQVDASPISCGKTDNSNLFIPMKTKVTALPNGALKVDAVALQSKVSFVVKAKYKTAKFYTTVGCVEFVPVYACVSKKANIVDMGTVSTQ